MKQKAIYILLVLLFSGTAGFLTFNRHSKSGINNYHSVIWSDKAGYYVYLPAVFKYHLDPGRFPDSIDSKTGGGFHLDLQKHKVVTRYTYGVALLQLPFFVVADLLARPLHFEPDGFSLIYHWAINVASVFYLVLGLLFLYRFQLYFTREKIAILTILSLFLATNLYYYSVDETGMSHVYSFFLFSFFLFQSRRTTYLADHRFWQCFLLGIVSCLIVIIRPSNILFLSTFFLLDLQSRADLVKRIRTITRPGAMIPLVIGAVLVILPQVAYWKYAYGFVVHYTYEHERFNWMNPVFSEVFFSPNNGLLPYCPFFLLIILSLIFMVRQKIINGFVIVFIFTAISYVFSAWWARDFGCAFGARAYVEYLALLSFPVTFLYDRINRMNSSIKVAFCVLVIAMIVFNLKLTYSYDGCFYGGTWDWQSYFKLVLSPTK